MSTLHASNHSMFDDKTFADVTIKFGDNEISAHKVILARKSQFFFRALTGNFPVASSGEVDLGEDDDPEVIRAMIRHIYDLPYDQMAEDTASDAATYSTNQDLLFHINVFTVADKYDVPCLRLKVVAKFKELMVTSWESDEFASIIHKLTGPSAGHLADHSLQAVAATFCAKRLHALMKQQSFTNMVEEAEPFAGRLLASIVSEGTLPVMKIMTCYRTECLAKKEIGPYISNTVCTHCGLSHTEVYYDSDDERVHGLGVFKKATLLVEK